MESVRPTRILGAMGHSRQTHTSHYLYLRTRSRMALDAMERHRLVTDLLAHCRQYLCGYWRGCGSAFCFGIILGLTDKSTSLWSHCGRIARPQFTVGIFGYLDNLYPDIFYGRSLSLLEVRVRHHTSHSRTDSRYLHVGDHGESTRQFGIPRIGHAVYAAHQSKVSQS